MRIFLYICVTNLKYIIMKNVYLLLVFLWACYMLATKPGLKPSDDYLLFFLSLSSVFVSGLGLIEWFYKLKK